MRRTPGSRISIGRLAPAFAILLLVATATYVFLAPTRRSDPATSAVSPTSQPSPVANAAAREGDAKPSASATAGRIVAARRGSLVETLTLNGRIGAATETPLSFQSAQRVSTIRVSAGDKVTAGQVLAEADQRELARSLAAARDRYATAKAKLDQAEAQLATKARTAEQRQNAVRVRAERGVAEADAGVRRAEANLERVRAGASPAERRAADIAVTSSRASLARAESDLSRLRQGPDDLELRQAEQQVVVSQAVYQRAASEVERLKAGADPNLVRAAERDVLSAQNAVVRAGLDLERIAQPDPVALSAAQRDVQRAQTALRLAEQNDRSSNSTDKAKDTKAAQAERKAGIDNAKLNLQDATDRYEKLRAGPPPGEILVAQRNLVSSRSVLDAARERLELVRQGADQSTIEQAKIAADSARLTYEAAVSKTTVLRAGPPDEQMTAAIAAYETAQASLRSAQALQAELLARPTQDELREAGEGLYAAKGALEQASVEAQVVSDTPTDEVASEIEPLRQAVDQEQTAVRALESDLQNARITAPFDGVVVNVGGRPDQGIDASRAVLTLAATDSDPIVLADVPTNNGSRLAVGQRATIKYGGQTSGEIAAPIGDVSDLGSGLVRVQLNPTWSTPPSFGAPASIDVVTRERTDVVIVPERALIGTGPRRSVQIVEGDVRRTVQVDVGLITGGEAEIVNGLEPDANVVTT